ncbi:hypothetical protein FRC08_011474, partial [Ceratobasidium sp. 394]
MSWQAEWTVKDSSKGEDGTAGAAGNPGEGRAWRGGQGAAIVDALGSTSTRKSRVRVLASDVGSPMPLR